MLFLDIDGVVFPLAKTPGEEILVPSGYVEAHCMFNISYNPLLPEWLRKHQKSLYWASTWGQDVTQVNDLLGLVDRPCLDVSVGRWQAVQSKVKQLDLDKFVWVEDQPQSQAVKAQVNQAGGLLLTPQRHLGLTRAMMDKADRFLLD